MTDYRQWTTAISTSHTDYETLKRLKDCGVDAIELSVSCEDSDTIAWTELRKNADAAGIEIWSYHLPFSQEVHIASPDEEYRTKMVAYLESMIEKACAIGIRRFVIHPSTEPITDEERPLQMAASKKSLAELAQFADERGAVLCVEDLPRTCLGHTADEVAELISVDDRLMVCFDVNHLLTVFGCTHREFVEKLGHRIVTTHMSDYDFLNEKHFFPGYGMINWAEVVELLEAADYTGPFLYEGGFSPSSWAPEVPHGTYEMARERHMTIKELTGKMLV